MSRRTLALAGTGLAGLLFTFAGLAPAGDPILDPSDPPVRLKKKEKPAREQPPEKKKEPEVKDKDKPVVGKENPDQPPQKKEEAKKPARPQPDQAEAERKKLVARVRKNMRDAEGRLARNNAGKGTQDVQRRILEDLDKLIEESKKQPPSSQCSCQKQSKKLSRSKSKSQTAKSSKGSSSSGSQGGGQKNQPKGGQKNNQGNTAQNNQQGGPKKDPREGTKENQAGGKNDKAGNVGGKGGADKTPPNDRAHMADIFKDVWGHLPETLRQEMDAYSRARFVPEYDALLRQYYRTISEQGRRKKGD